MLLRSLFLALLLGLTLAVAAAADARAIDDIARAARGSMGRHPHRVVAPHRPWRPSWWPRRLPAGTGRPQILIRLGEQRLYLHDGRKLWKTFPVSTGAKRGATPRGAYRIVVKQRLPDWTYKGQHVEGGTLENPLGICWLGLGMPPGWRGAPIGMHGTNAPGVIGRPVSHGCIRLRNPDAQLLYKTAPLGCRVLIVP